MYLFGKYIPNSNACQTRASRAPMLDCGYLKMIGAKPDAGRTCRLDLQNRLGGLRGGREDSVSRSAGKGALLGRSVGHSFSRSGPRPGDAGACEEGWHRGM